MPEVKMDALINRLEKLTAPDVECNVRLWALAHDRQIMGWQPSPVRGWLARNDKAPHDVCMAPEDVNYTGLFDTAWTLVPADCSVEMYFDPPNKWLGQIEKPHNKYNQGKSINGAIALCIAALKARR